MATKKHRDQNRRIHVAKVLEGQTTKNLDYSKATNQKEKEIHSHEVPSPILQQFRLIRQDVLKLREDLNEGYDLLKDWVDTNLIRKFIRQR